MTVEIFPEQKLEMICLDDGTSSRWGNNTKGHLLGWDVPPTAQRAVAASTPLLLAATGELVTERAGVLAPRAMIRS